MVGSIRRRLARKLMIRTFDLRLAAVALLVIVICLLTTFPGWHEEVDENGSAMDVKTFPSRTVTLLATVLSTFASALVLLSVFWQHVASVAFVTTVQNMTYGTVKGHVGAESLVLGWIAVATMMLASCCLGVMRLSISLLDRLVDD